MSWKIASDVRPNPTLPTGDASSNVAPRPRRAPSLATRLTAWYAVSAFALLAVASGVLYIALERSLDADNDRVLAGRIDDVRTILRARPDARHELADQADDAATPRQHTPIMFRIIQPDGAILVETPGMADRLVRAAFAPPIPGTDSTGAGEELRAPDGHRYRALAGLARGPVNSATLTPGPYTIQAALSLHPQEHLLALYRKRLYLTMSAALVACIVVGYEIARRGIRPIQNITEIARRTRSTALDARIDPSPMPAEVQLLAGEFNEMLDRLQQQFARISRFSADIAHELRTPVNNLRGTAEVALSKARSPDEYRDALESCIEECVRLGHIIENLLFLARAEDPAHQIKRDSIDLKHELETVADFYEASATEAGVHITTRVENGPIRASINRTLFQRAVGNLLNNSIAHTPDGGRITVVARRDNGSLLIEVADTGRGIPAEHVPRVFDRLYRVADDRSKNTGGAGLGLAIVRSIAASHGGKVAIESKVNEGTRVRIEIPLTEDAPVLTQPT